MYVSNTGTGKTQGKISYFQFPNLKAERKQVEIWLKNISAGYNSKHLPGCVL